MKKLIVLLLAFFAIFSLVSCDAADVAANNISKDADQFKVLRKIIFYDVITGEYMYSMEGYCSIFADTVDEQLEVTCKIGEEQYIKNYLGVSDNVSYMVLQLEASNVDPYHYKIYLRPNTLIPDIETDIDN